MQTYIALLRGINVGGHKKVPMAELRELLNKIALKNIKTYIQTGNVIFKSTEENKNKLEELIKNAIFSHFGFEVSVLVKNTQELKAIFNSCPFAQAEKENSYFAMLSKVPNKDLVTEASQKIYPNESYIITKGCIYFYAEIGYGKAKFNLNYFEKKLKLKATARNYKTMVKLLSLSEN